MKALVFYALVVALVASVAVQAQAPAGGEFRVNNATAGTQTFPSVGSDPSGNFVVVWVETNTTPQVINGQRFDARGARRGSEFRVNVTTTANTFRPVVSVGPKGRFLVVWHEAVPVSGAPVGAFGRWFDGSGPSLGAEFRLNQTTAGVPAAALGAGGGFVATWNGYTDGSSISVVGRRFDSAGNPLGPEFTVNTFTTDVQFRPSVAAAENGNFVIVWSSNLQDGSGLGIFGQRFDAAGARAGAEFQVNSNGGGAQNFAQVASDPAGNFVVIWQHVPPGGPKSIVGRRFTAAGAPSGAEFVVNTFSTGYIYYMSIARERAGSFTVTWETRGTDGSGSGIFGQRYSPSGVPRGANFLVNATTTLEQVIPDIASDGAGNHFATWMSNHLPPTTSYDVFARRFGGLFPAAMNVVDGGNNVLEVPDDFGLVTSWRNMSGTAQTFQGHASNVVAPPGLILTMSGDANYGTVADGATGSCGTPCYAGGLFGTRPSGHLDITFDEAILPDTQGQAKPWRVHVGGSFTDVPRTNAFYRFVETLLHHGVTGGCGGTSFCPAESTTRGQMAVFVLVAKEGAGYLPPACGTPTFPDMPAASPFCRWVEELARRGVVSGCGGGNFCPDTPVTREQMAVFVLRTLDPLLNPPACASPTYNDVPASSPFCRWIEELTRRGIVSGCGGGNYCPTLPVTREQMGVFIDVTFGLTLYGP